ncbi:MAG TPA: carboxylesterase family protein, partial [Alphaproteobacteria bacterium]|nr:carboxylesterase family protein [Alphaproteobacteria bacterium]
MAGSAAQEKRGYAAAAFALACLAAFPAQAQTRPTESGPVKGLTLDEVAQFRAVPYAAPPVGDLRWRPPQAPLQHSGTLDATAYGPACEQDLAAYPVSEDCLTLNIFTPAPASRTSRLPVMVWIHGGAFVSGSGRDFDATALVRNGRVLVVTINYRLGYLGFLAHPALSRRDPNHVSGNYGILDQQAALAWVRRNIAGFGGNPKRITIFGESAGGQSVIDQLVSPTAGPLAAAIAQSGSYMTTLPTLAAAETSGQAAAKSLGCPGQGRACLYGLPADKIGAALNPLTSLQSVSPVVDGLTLPLQPAAAFAAGKFQRIPVINGSNHDEYRLFTGLQRGLENAPALTAQNYFANVKGQFGPIARKVLDAYPLRDFAIPDYAYDAILTDVAFACNTHLLNAQMARYTSVWEYELDDPDAPVASGPVVPGFSYGSPHSADLSYLFPTYNVAGFHPHGPPPLSADQRTLRATIHQYWINMAHRGDPAGPKSPAWPAFTNPAHAILSLRP